MAREYPANITSSRAGLGTRHKTWGLSCCFPTLAVGDYNLGEAARVYRKGAAGHTDGARAQDLTFSVSAVDTGAGGGRQLLKPVW